MSNAAKKSAPITITKADAISNVDSEKSVSLVNGIIRLTYHESILQDSVKAYVVFSDVGNAIEGKSAVEGLPLIGTEDFRLEFEDNNEENDENRNQENGEEYVGGASGSHESSNKIKSQKQIEAEMRANQQELEADHHKWVDMGNGCSRYWDPDSSKEFMASVTFFAKYSFSLARFSLSFIKVLGVRTNLI